MSTLTGADRRALHRAEQVLVTDGFSGALDNTMATGVAALGSAPPGCEAVDMTNP